MSDYPKAGWNGEVIPGGWDSRHARPAGEVAGDDLDALLAEAERRGAERALREAADEMDRFRTDTYGEDIFRRPTSEEYAAINALLQREYGHGTDRIGADCYDRAIRRQADILRARADEIGGTVVGEVAW